MGLKRYEKISKNEQKNGEIKQKRTLEEEQRKFALINKGIEKKEEKSVEEEQIEFASKKVQEEKYTLENQKEYIEYLNKMFIDGKVNSKNIEKIKEELSKYPDKVQSSLFLSEIYYAITEKEEKGIEQINECINSKEFLSKEEHKTLDEKVRDFRKRIDLKEYLAKKEEEQKIREKELKQEQREYSRQIIKSLDNGELKKEDIPQIAKKLEKYPDRSKAIFLIMKLYEGYYGRTEALQALIRYNSISDLSDSEKDMIVKMRNSINNNRNVNTIRQRQQKVKLRKIKSIQYKKKYKETQRNFIEDMLKQGKTVKSIQMEAEISGDIVSLKSISKIRTHLIATDDAMKSMYEDEMTMAKQLVDGGFSVEQIYDLFGSNIGKNKLMEMRMGQER